MLSLDFKEFIQSLNGNGVRYLVVGGYALALHGHPRYTKDIDIWVGRDPGNAIRILQALKAFGFGSLPLAIADFLAPDRTIQLGCPPNLIDLLTSLTGLQFEDCYPECMNVDIDGVPIPFIDLANFIRNKRATGRLQDLADARLLEGEESAGV